jgi:hypothetical protein
LKGRWNDEHSCESPGFIGWVGGSVNAISGPADPPSLKTRRRPGRFKPVLPSALGISLSGIRPPASGIWHPASGIRHPASGIRHPASGI